MSSEQNQNKPFKTISLLILILATLAFTNAFNGSKSTVTADKLDSGPTKSQRSAETFGVSTVLPRLKDNVNSVPVLTAKSYLIYHTDSSKILLSYNANEPLPIASLTKLTTALLVSRHLSPEKVISVEASTITALPKPLLGFEDGEEIKASSLVEGMLVASANDAAVILAESIKSESGTDAVVLMNTLAQALGLERTHYSNPSGFDSPENFSTALDILAVVFEIRRTPWLSDLLTETNGQISSVDGSTIHRFKTTNSLLTNASDIVTAGKTGFTDEARGNMVVFAKSPGNSEIIAVLLGSEQRELEMLSILNWVIESYIW